MTSFIVDLSQYYVCCIRSGLTLSALCMVIYLYRMCQMGYTPCFDRTSVYLRASSLQNLAVPQDLYSPFSVSVERSCRACIQWCGTVRVSRAGRMLYYWPNCSLPFCLLQFSLSLPSFYRLVLYNMCVHNQIQNNNQMFLKQNEVVYSRVWYSGVGSLY